VLCLDSGCADYDRLWVTTSLRGLAGGTLKVDILEEGVHSGAASGVVPSTFRIARHLLDRLEDSATGEILLPDLHVTIPEDRRRQAEETAAATPVYASTHRFVPGARPVVDDPVEQILNHTWRPTLSVVGADGLPPTTRAGNVLRPSTALQLSLRLPPTCDANAALASITDALTHDPPYGARVTFAGREAGPGWNAPPFAPWLDTALERASQAAFGAPARAFGEGGTIPFMGMLGQRFPDAQFVITGVLGPDSNAHGPNEYLHLPTARRVTAALAMVLDDHARR
jgi:acetylornithine deacetylase/succinyl-diaminopimelate desuccinylase-like protein